MNMFLSARSRKRFLKKVTILGVCVLTIGLLFCFTRPYLDEEEEEDEDEKEEDKCDIQCQLDIALRQPSETFKIIIPERSDTQTLLSYTSSKNINHSTRKSWSLRHSQKNVRTILTWNDFFSMKHFNIGVGKELFRRLGCKVYNCELWHRLGSVETLPHDEYDALVFHGIDTGNSSIEDLPLVRRPHQRYIFYLGESPGMRPNIYNLKNFFNWTATYRRDSDLYKPYVVFKSRRTGKVVLEWMAPTFKNMSHVPEAISNKTKLVAWFSYNTRTQSQRHTYAEWLSEHISLDIYWEDKELKCPRNASEECDKMLGRDYKFYLAFENSLCDDYLTEEILRPFRYNTVPIVYGGADYTRMVPPHSYIDVRDFKSPRQLADYLYYLNENPEEYHKYFWWKQYYYEDTGTSFWCNLCEKLNKAHEPNKVYPVIESWWIYPNVCQSVEEHFKKKQMGRMTSMHSQGNKPLIYD